MTRPNTHKKNIYFKTNLKQIFQKYICIVEAASKVFGAKRILVYAEKLECHIHHNYLMREKKLNLDINMFKMLTILKLCNYSYYNNYVLMCMMCYENKTETRSKAYYGGKTVEQSFLLFKIFILQYISHKNILLHSCSSIKK
ncbi:Protein of unknown function, partial [Gryllus bimaculatus]